MLQVNRESCTELDFYRRRSAVAALAEAASEIAFAVQALRGVKDPPPLEQLSLMESQLNALRRELWDSTPAIFLLTPGDGESGK